MSVSTWAAAIIASRMSMARWCEASWREHGSLSMYVNNGAAFRDKLQRGQVCLGTGITFGDPTVSEALCGTLDFVWIDMEHNPLSLETVQAHVMATRGTDTAP